MSNANGTPKDSVMPVLPVRGSALFPGTIMTVTVARTSTKNALASLDERRQIAVFAQKDPHQLEPSFHELHHIGTLAVVLRSMPLEGEDAVSIVLQGQHRIHAEAVLQTSPFLTFRVRELAEIQIPTGHRTESAGLLLRIREVFREIVESTSGLDNEVIPMVSSIQDPSRLTDFIAGTLPDFSGEIRQRLLDTVQVESRLEILLDALIRQNESLRIRRQIESDVVQRITEGQRQFILREQLHAIQKELGEDEDTHEEEAGLFDQIRNADLPEEVRVKAEREHVRLKKMPESAHEYTLTKSYLEWLLSLPWSKSAEGFVDLKTAEQVLDDEHYDLERIKERILEYLAVYTLKQNLRGPILCFVGPPGVGKTSLGRSIAHATHRPFERISLGGLHDEAELRGHRRTYVGALPGQILQALRRAGANDPVIMLDEIDKIGRDVRGDAAAALLEILDPAQNHAFRDNYLELPFDLSKILFICTANLLEPIPLPLLDRMEVIRLSGYIDDEKLHIAERYLVPRQIIENGLQIDKDVAFEPEAILQVIRGYTHEAGVRQLEQKLAAICRKRARQIASGMADGCLRIDKTQVREMLGKAQQTAEQALEERTRFPGVAVAMAWTPAGGDVLFVEATRLPRGTGEFRVTGQVKEVMQESARTAWSWVRAHATECGIGDFSFRDWDVHIHIPAGAIAKDGPSAGLVLVFALLSLFRQQMLSPCLAMTGEITLSGVILPVGGIREKILAAKRNGVREIVLPHDNEADVLENIAPHLLEGLQLHFAHNIEEVLPLALPFGARDGESRLPGPDNTHPTAPLA